MDTTLTSVMKNIADALQLDSNNKLEVVYLLNFFTDVKKIFIVPSETYVCLWFHGKVH